MAKKDRTMDDSMVSEQLQRLAEEHMKEGRHQEAAKLYKILAERHPGDDSFVLAMAWAYHDQGQIDEAIACFETLFQKELSRKIFTGFAFDELVRIFKRQGRYDRLLQICEQALTAQPDDYALLGDLGDACLKTGQPAKAAAVYRKMIKMEPDASIAYCNLGHALVFLEDFAGAEAAYEQAMAIEPEKAAPYFSRLADHYRQAGHTDRAEQAIRSSLALDKREPAYYLILGDLLIESGNMEEGWTAYASAAALRPSSAGAYYYRLGNTFSRASDHEKAVLAYQKAISCEAGNPFYFLHLAASYAALGQEELASEALRQADNRP